VSSTLSGAWGNDQMHEAGGSEQMHEAGGVSRCMRPGE
jgi:hypothetical protein